jgi:hypothetical protein
MDINRQASRPRTAIALRPVQQETCEAVARSTVAVRPIDKRARLARLARRKVTERLRRYFEELRQNLERDTEFSQQAMMQVEALAAGAQRPSVCQSNKE